MRIAVAYDNENGQVFQHFGHTENFMIYDVRDGAVVFKTLMPTNGSGHGALAAFLQGMGIDSVICGGIGGGAVAALMDAGILLFGGVHGNADAAVEALLAGRLRSMSAACCHHHEGGSCGEHDCGGHEDCHGADEGGCACH